MAMHDVSAEPILIEDGGDRGLFDKIDDVTDWPFPLYIVIGIYSVMVLLLLTGWGFE